VSAIPIQDDDIPELEPVVEILPEFDLTQRDVIWLHRRANILLQITKNRGQDPEEFKGPYLEAIGYHEHKDYTNAYRKFESIITLMEGLLMEDTSSLSMEPVKPPEPQDREEALIELKPYYRDPDKEQVKKTIPLTEEEERLFRSGHESDDTEIELLALEPLGITKEQVETRYRKALTLYEKGKYLKALKILKELNFYIKDE